MAPAEPAWRISGSFTLISGLRHHGHNALHRHGPSPQNELRTLSPQHFIGRHEPEVETDAGIGDLDALDRVRRHFVRDYNMPIHQCVRHKIEVRHLQKSVYRRRLIALAHGPGAHIAETGRNARVGLQKQVLPVRAHPIGQFILARADLIRHLVDAEHAARRIVFNQPLPERWAEIQAVVKILGLNEDIGVKQIAHNMTPISRAAS